MSGEALLGMTRSSPKVSRVNTIAPGSAHHASGRGGLTIVFRLFSSASKFPMPDAGIKALSIAASPRQDRFLHPIHDPYKQTIFRASPLSQSGFSISKYPRS